MAAFDKSPHQDISIVETLATIPGIGVITGSAIMASIGDGKQFKLAGSLRPGLASSHDKVQAAAKRSLAAYRSKATDISVSCLSQVPRLTFEANVVRKRQEEEVGPASCWNVSQAESQQWHWLARSHVLPWPS